MSVGRKLLASAERWGCKENEKLAMLLFVQKVRELLLHTTSIPAKPMFASPLSIAREILALLNQHAKTPHTSTETNLKNLVAEFELVLAEDWVARDSIGDRLRHVIRCLLDFSDSRNQIEAAQFLIGRFAVRRYIAASGKRIVEIVEAGGREKAELLALAEGFISAIKEAGYPTQTIYHLFNVAFFDHERKIMTAKQRLEAFFSNFDFEYHTYLVFFGLNELADKVSETFKSIGGEYWAVGSEEYNLFLESLHASNRRFFCQLEHQGVVKFKDIRALDPQSARVEAERRLRLLDDLLRFSVHGRRFAVQNQALVLKENAARFVNSNRPKQPILLVPHDSDNGHEGLSSLAAALRRTRDSSNERFIRAIELHGTALSAQEDESQLLNMWIALETLFVSGGGGSKVREIVNAITPYVLASWNEYVIAELWEKVEAQHIDAWTEAVKTSPKLLEDPGHLQFIKAVAVREFEPEMTKFLKQLDGDPLLRFKIFECIQWAQEAKTIRAQISKIKNKVLNDINRVYRIRNQIVHIGGSKGNMSDAVQIAHYYLDLVLAMLSFLLGSDNGCKSIEQANMEVQIKMENFDEKLNANVSNGVQCDVNNYYELLFGRPLLA